MGFLFLGFSLLPFFLFFSKYKKRGSACDRRCEIQELIEEWLRPLKCPLLQLSYFENLKSIFLFLKTELPLFPPWIRLVAAQFFNELVLFFFFLSQRALSLSLWVFSLSLLSFSIKCFYSLSRNCSEGIFMRRRSTNRGLPLMDVGFAAFLKIYVWFHDRTVRKAWEIRTRLVHVTLKWVFWEPSHSNLKLQKSHYSLMSFSAIIC